MQIVAIVLEVLLGLAFLGAGGPKLAGAKGQKEMFTHLGYPEWFLYVAGAVEVFGGLGMLAGIFSPLWALLAGLLLAAQMIGALVSHARAKDPTGRLAPASVLLALALAVVFLEYLALGS